MADQCYSAWSAVFGPGAKWLLCTWHIDRAWRGQLKLIEKRQFQATVYHNLRVLLEETDSNTFESLLKATMEQLQTNSVTQTFGAYFSQYYVQNMAEWAKWYRRNAAINTNMYVESFHRVLKHAYLKRKVNKRVDKCIHTLLPYARDKALDRLIKLHKGKATHYVSIIASRHKESSRIEQSTIEARNDNTWMVRSATSEHMYCVVKETDNHITRTGNILHTQTTAPPAQRYSLSASMA